MQDTHDLSTEKRSNVCFSLHLLPFSLALWVSCSLSFSLFPSLIEFSLALIHCVCFYVSHQSLLTPLFMHRLRNDTADAFRFTSSTRYFDRRKKNPNRNECYPCVSYVKFLLFFMVVIAAVVLLRICCFECYCSCCCCCYCSCSCCCCCHCRC